MNLLTPDPGLLFWMLLSFAIVFFLLAKFGFPVIVEAINKRKEFIESSLHSAQQANERLAKIEQEIEQMLTEAKAQQKEIIASALQEKKQIVQAAEEEAQAQAKEMVEAAAERIRDEKEKALRDVRGEVATLAIDVAEKILMEKMSDPDAQKRAINSIIDSL